MSSLWSACKTINISNSKLTETVRWTAKKEEKKIRTICWGPNETYTFFLFFWSIDCFISSLRNFLYADSVASFIYTCNNSATINALQFFFPFLHAWTAWTVVPNFQINRFHLYFIRLWPSEGTNAEHKKTPHTEL